MAVRDQSQGFGFIYAEIEDFLAQRYAPLDFQQPMEVPKEKVLFPVPDAERAENKKVESVKNNLDRLSDLHQKLHVILEELNQLNPKKKK